jgi:hypothetical protein
MSSSLRTGMISVATKCITMQVKARIEEII